MEEEKEPCTHDGPRVYKDGQWKCCRCEKPLDQKPQRKFNKY